jgi:hypothetical protein
LHHHHHHHHHQYQYKYHQKDTLEEELIMIDTTSSITLLFEKQKLDDGSSPAGSCRRRSVSFKDETDEVVCVLPKYEKDDLERLYYTKDDIRQMQQQAEKENFLTRVENSTVGVTVRDSLQIISLRDIDTIDGLHGTTATATTTSSSTSPPIQAVSASPSKRQYRSDQDPFSSPRARRGSNDEASTGRNVPSTGPRRSSTGGPPPPRSPGILNSNRSPRRSTGPARSPRNRPTTIANTSLSTFQTPFSPENGVL